MRASCSFIISHMHAHKIGVHVRRRHGRTLAPVLELGQIQYNWGESEREKQK